MIISPRTTEKGWVVLTGRRKMEYWKVENENDGTRILVHRLTELGYTPLTKSGSVKYPTTGRMVNR